MAADRLIGAGFFILGIVMAWASTQIAFPMLGEGDPGPQVLPLALGVLIALLGAMLSLRKPAAEAGGEAPLFDDADTATLIPAETPLMRVVHVVNLVAYAVLFERLGSHSRPSFSWRLPFSCSARARCAAALRRSWWRLWCP
jgi:hypothetical protein